MGPIVTLVSKRSNEASQPHFTGQLGRRDRSGSACLTTSCARVEIGWMLGTESATGY